MRRSASARTPLSVAVSDYNIEAGAMAGTISSYGGKLLAEGLGAERVLRRESSHQRPEMDDGLAEDATQACSLRDVRDLFLEVVHVGIRRRARLDHFERREARAARTNSGHGPGYRRKNVICSTVHQRRSSAGRDRAPSARACACEQPGHNNLPDGRSTRRRRSAPRSTPECQPPRVPPSIATAPGESTRAEPSIVTTMPPVSTSETVRLGGCAKTTDPAARRHAQIRNSMDEEFYQSFLCLSLFPFPFYSDPVPLHLVSHPLVHDALATLRDASTPPELFRRMAVQNQPAPRRGGHSRRPGNRGDCRDAARACAGPPDHAQCRVVPVLRAGLGMLDAVL